MILEIDSVDLRFGEKIILNSVYAAFETGQVTGLLGRNGCGKSCLFQIVFGSLNADYSTIRIDKKYQKELYKSRIVQYLPQNFTIPDNLTVKKAIALLGSNIVECQMFFDSHKMSIDAKFSNLSGGQRRLAEIIIFLNTASKFIILDEPFTHLMPIQIEELKEIISLAKTNKSIIISDHQYRHLIDISDKVYLIKDAKTYQLSKQNVIEDLQKFMYIL